MFSFQILNHPEHFTIDASRVHEIFRLVSEVLESPWEEGKTMSTTKSQGGLCSPLAQNGILNIAFLSDDEIRALNREHRGIDKTTDVLSFHYFDDFSEVTSDEVAGEIILSESRIMSQSAELGHPPRQEFEILLIHSILHILGFDHETEEEYLEMWRFEEKIRVMLL